MSATKRRRGRLRGVVAAVAGFALVTAGAGVAAVTASRAQAADTASSSAVLDGFDPADIISDSAMYDSGTMTAADIQAFLNRQQPTCASGATCLKSVKVDMPRMTANPMCRAVAAKSGASAAQVVAAVAKACSLNPQVILVMLQKEQTLVTGRRPGPGETVSLIYRKATGLGCPDTSACDPAKYGLFNQLYGVAYWLIRYTTPPGTTGAGWTAFSWFPVGKPSGVLYNSDPTCGARTITIKNKATASLYYYTPYQPNSAALAAGWGLGDSCSAYGNRNFFLYFTTWFGSSGHVVTGAIKTFWSAHRSTYGDPVGDAVAVSGGTSQRFARGTVYTSSAGTFGVAAGAMLTKYTALGGPAGKLGWPRKAQTTRTGTHAGRVQGFQHGTIYVSSRGTAAVLAPVYATYMSAGYELGSLGYPIGDAVTGDGGTVQRFAGGAITAAGSTTTTVTGSTFTTWLKRGGQTGTLGWPTAAIRTVRSGGKKGTVQTFTSGFVTVQGGRTYSVTGPLARNYRSHGGPAGVLGWPTSVSTRSTAGGGGWFQRFTHGAVYLGPPGTHAIAAGSGLKLYDQRGGTTGTLGWLVLSANDRTGIGGKVDVFEHGRILTSRKGTYAVLGAILQRWLDGKGTRGVLGWPTSNAHRVGGTTVQTFEHGSITWTAAGGTSVQRAS